MRKMLALAAILITTGLAAQESRLQLQLPGSAAYATLKDAPAGGASLYLDSTSFDGKSGMVRLQKALAGEARAAAVHLHVVDAIALTPEVKDKPFSNKAPLARNGHAVVESNGGVVTMHLQAPARTGPFPTAAVVLAREGEQLMATLNIRSKQVTILGTVPVRECTPVFRVIDE